MIFYVNENSYFFYLCHIVFHAKIQLIIRKKVLIVYPIRQKELKCISKEIPKIQQQLLVFLPGHLLCKRNGKIFSCSTASTQTISFFPSLRSSIRGISHKIRLISIWILRIPRQSIHGTSNLSLTFTTDSTHSFWRIIHVGRRILQQQHQTSRPINLSYYFR